ncbi:diguanylate cyclase [Anaerobiospirillum sp. NML120448]|uniref:diguanylate cyclase n=1 Tax=Anaerobiospirillum sp. NML120448 TaxID=2932816 RepID=UPI001FF1D6ED|nr:diguanylate cyclase [Anaerobiospirillum sp. NML120448]MCK0515422.1 diguanylate cyclase [Anaerobiospirillum sp. NML120448]
MKSKIETITKTTQAPLDKEALNHASSLSESELLKKICPRSNGTCPHKQTGCTNMCTSAVSCDCSAGGCGSAIFNPELYDDEHHMSTKDTITSFQLSDYMGLMPQEQFISELEPKSIPSSELYNDNVEDTLHYLNLNQAFAITERLTERSNLTFELSDEAKKVNKAIHQTADTQVFTDYVASLKNNTLASKNTTNYIYQGHISDFDSGKTSSASQHLAQELAHTQHQIEGIKYENAHDNTLIVQAHTAIIAPASSEAMQAQGGIENASAGARRFNELMAKRSKIYSIPKHEHSYHDKNGAYLKDHNSAHEQELSAEHLTQSVLNDHAYKQSLKEANKVRSHAQKHIRAQAQANHQALAKAHDLSTNKVKLEQRAVNDAVSATDYAFHSVDSGVISNGDQASASSTLEVAESQLLAQIRGTNLCASPLTESLRNQEPDPNYDQARRVFDEAQMAYHEYAAPSLKDITKTHNDEALKENLLNLEHSIHVLMNIIGCGVFIQSIGPNHERRLLWANKGLFDLMGYDPDYIMSLDGADFADRFLHPDDVDNFFNSFTNSETAQSLSVVYRAKHGKTGQYLWCSVKSAYLGRSGDNNLYMCLLNDITRERRLKDRMARWIRKNELLSEACQELIFEYDQNEDRLERFGNYQHYVPSVKPLQENYLQFFKNSDFIHPDDRELYESIFTDRTIADGKSRRTVKFRLRPTNSTEYQWHVCSIIGYTEETTGHIMIIGKLYSIHNYEAKIAMLNKENKLDPMTKLLNKTTMEHSVASALSEGQDIGQHQAMLMIDIDDFKKVNDTHGHAFGDEVILMVAKCLKNAFRSSDLVGRMGGDEFMVMLQNVSVEQAISLANIYQQIIKEEAQKLSIPYPVSSSVGIAFAPENGSTYENLFEIADQALYLTKQTLKGQVSCNIDGETKIVSNMPNVLHNSQQRLASLMRKIDAQ